MKKPLTALAILQRLIPTETLRHAILEDRGTLAMRAIKRQIAEPTPTITLADREDVVRFERGQSIDEMTEEDARAILGDAAYAEWREAKKSPSTSGRVTVTKIGR